MADTWLQLVDELNALASKASAEGVETREIARQPYYQGRTDAFQEAVRIVAQFAEDMEIREGRAVALPDDGPDDTVAEKDLKKATTARQKRSRTTR